MSDIKEAVLVDISADDDDAPPSEIPVSANVQFGFVDDINTENKIENGGVVECAKNRFNLRKRPRSSSLYEDYNDFDFSDEEEEVLYLESKKKTFIASGEGVDPTIPGSAYESRSLRMAQIDEASHELLNRDMDDASQDSVDIDEGNSNVHRRSRGGPASKALTPLEEHELATCISAMSRCGKAVSQTDIKLMAMNMLEAKDKKAFRKGNCPTAGWIHKFRMRHPDLEYKTMEHPLMKTSGPVTKEDLNCWFSEIKQYLSDDWSIEIESFFSDKYSRRIFTCDEILIAFSKVDEKGENMPLKSIVKNSNDDKQLVTVIAAANAMGDFLKPHLLLSRMPEDKGQFPILDVNSYEAVLSETGLTTPDIFLQWIHYFDSHLNKHKIERPVVLLMDDHVSHFYVRVFKFCLEKRIIPICLPPKLNKMLQPLLTSFFPKLMMAYQACCKRYSSKTGNLITHNSFPYIMMKAWTLVTKPKFIAEGFTVCKLIPMNVLNLATEEMSMVKNSCTEPLHDSKEKKVSSDMEASNISFDHVSMHKTSEVSDKASIVGAKSTLFSSEQVDVKISVPCEPEIGKRENDDCKQPPLKKIKITTSPTSSSLRVVTSVNGSNSSSSSNNGLSSGNSSGSNCSSSGTVSVTSSSSCAAQNSATIEAESNLKANSSSVVNGCPSQSRDVVLSDKYVSEERRIGRREGVKMCLSLIESFVPADILPVWRQRAASHEGTCEVGYCMWKAVQMLQKDGVDATGKASPQLLQFDS